MAANTAFDGRDLARVAVFAALIVVLGTVPPIPVPGLVPVTAQTLGVMLAGTVLGARRGAAAVLIVLVLVAVGLPVLSGGRGGLGVFVGPTGGYLVGWVLGAAVAGLIARWAVGRVPWWRAALGALVGGVLVVYACGIPVTALVAGIGVGDAAVAALAFVPGDLLKVVAATVLTVALQRAYPPAFALPRRGAAGTSA